MDIATIIALTKMGQGLVFDLLPLFINRDSDGNIKNISIGVILENTDARNAETLKMIAEANAQLKKPNG
jgi:hypothetical protein